MPHGPTVYRKISSLASNTVNARSFSRPGSYHATFDRVGGYEEGQLAEDLRFFLRLLELGGKLVKVGSCGGDPVEGQGGARKEEIPPLLCYRHTGVSRSPLRGRRVGCWRRCAYAPSSAVFWIRTGGPTAVGMAWKKGTYAEGCSFFCCLFLPCLENESVGIHYLAARAWPVRHLGGRARRPPVPERPPAALSRPRGVFCGRGRKQDREFAVCEWRSTWITAHRNSPLAGDSRASIVLCVAMGRTNGLFEKNVRELAEERGLVETTDYWHFN